MLPNKNLFYQSVKVLAAVVVLMVSCKSEPKDDTIHFDPNTPWDSVAGYWSSKTHTTQGKPDFNGVFDQSKVQNIKIVVNSADWQQMVQEVSEYAVSGMPASAFVPAYRKATVICNHIGWKSVGIKFASPSDLRSAVQDNNKKYAIKLDFDQFENEVKGITDQRFYGFKKLKLFSCYGDPSYLRSKLSSDFYQSFGVPAQKAAYYALYIDYGSGPVYYGLYLMTEEVSNTTVKYAFAGDDGNLYKAETDLSSLAFGVDYKNGFSYEGPLATPDFNDLTALYNMVHSPLRTQNEALWRTQLERVFDVDLFIKWLAVSTALHNYKTYGTDGDNFYLYTIPTTNKMSFVPAINVETLYKKRSKHGINEYLLDVTTAWPIIRYVADNQVYYAAYKQYYNAFLSGYFTPQMLKGKIDSYETMLKPYIDIEPAGISNIKSVSEFTDELKFLRTISNVPLE